MRDYLSPAKRVVERVMPHPAAARAFLLRHKAFAFIVTATIVVITTLGFVSVRALVTTQTNDQRTVEAKSNSTTLQATTTTVPDQPTPAQTDTQEGTMQSSDSSAPQTKTDVTVNNQKIDVPQNGTTQKTITNGDGSTTNVTITTNSDSNNNSSSSTYVTTNTGSSQTITSNNTSITRTNQ